MLHVLYIICNVTCEIVSTGKMTNERCYENGAEDFDKKKIYKFLIFCLRDSTQHSTLHSSEESQFIRREELMHS